MDAVDDQHFPFLGLVENEENGRKSLSALRGGG